MERLLLLNQTIRSECKRLSGSKAKFSSSASRFCGKHGLPDLHLTMNTNHQHFLYYSPSPTTLLYIPHQNPSFLRALCVPKKCLTPTEVRGQPSGPVPSSTMRFLGSNSGCQTWQIAPAKPSPWAQC